VTHLEPRDCPREASIGHIEMHHFTSVTAEIPRFPPIRSHPRYLCRSPTAARRGHDQHTAGLGPPREGILPLGSASGRRAATGPVSLGRSLRVFQVGMLLRSTGRTFRRAGRRPSPPHTSAVSATTDCRLLGCSITEGWPMTTLWCPAAAGRRRLSRSTGMIAGPVYRHCRL